MTAYIISILLADTEIVGDCLHLPNLLRMLINAITILFIFLVNNIHQYNITQRLCVCQFVCDIIPGKKLVSQRKDWHSQFSPNHFFVQFCFFIKYSL